MAKINLQFHATKNELINFIFETATIYNFNVIAVQLFPFQYYVINKDKFFDYKLILKKSVMIILSYHTPTINYENYNELIEHNNNNLIFQLGEHNENELKESSIGTMGSDIELHNLWKRIINKFKKNLLKGAWIINPSFEKKHYSKNHYYTEEAKQEFLKGVKILPIAGWNYYLLIKDID